MIRIERNTDNLFSLLQFIAFVINTFSHLTDPFMQSDLQENVKLHLVRGIKLATLQLQTNFSTHWTIVILILFNTYIDILPYTATYTASCLALAALAVLDFAMIMVLFSLLAFMIISCSPAEKKEALSLSLEPLY